MATLRAIAAPSCKEIHSSLNFVVAGEIRSGTAIVQTSLNQHPRIVCHGNLFAADDAARRVAHEDYFGASKDPERFPEWFTERDTNPYRYLNHYVFDHPQRGESVVGIRVLYDRIRNLDLTELFQQRDREGDFCLVHVRRNPVACFVSLKQAQRSNVWQSETDDLVNRPCPPAVSIDIEELRGFVRQSMAMTRRIENAVADCLTVTYADLFYNYAETMRQVLEFLEVDPDTPVAPGVRRLRNRRMCDRISNWSWLRATAPHEIQQYLTAADLI